MARATAHPSRSGSAPPLPYGDASARIFRGEALDVLATLPPGTAQTAVTSPPYWGLRDYGVPTRIWGAEPGCRRHRWIGNGDGIDVDSGHGQFCERCGAWRGCLGLEPDPELYVEHLVEVMRQVRRALRDDGTLWLVIGDSFAKGKRASGSRSRPDPSTETVRRSPAGTKPKDLIGIPWRVAFAMQADGWWLRSDIVWQKPNVMPESVRDRPTRSHEFVFLFSKSPRYFYDAEAVREPDQGGRSGNGYVRPERLSYGGNRRPRGQEHGWVGGGGRNRRSVWTIPTQCFKGAHFATFPEALVEPCVLAGSSPVACSTCGSPWRRIVNSRRILDGKQEIQGGWTSADKTLRSGRSLQPTGYGSRRVEIRRETVGWEPTCDHDDPGARCTVLDPFAGAGTTGIVATRQGRDFLGVELSTEYARLGRRRIRDAAVKAGESTLSSKKPNRAARCEVSGSDGAHV